MAWTAQVEIEGEDYGTMQLEGEFRRGEYAPPASYAYFCTSCGNVWARVTIVERPYSVWSISCRSCGNRFTHSLETVGSLRLPWERSFNDSFPRKVLLREFEIEVEEWMKSRSLKEAA